MERLTGKDTEGTYFITPMGNALSAPELSLNNVRILLDRLAAYEDAEEAGLLVRLPCKVGDTVYRIEVGCCEYRENDACAAYCDGYDYSCPDYKADRRIVVGHFSLNDIASLGKNVFLIREEAELEKEG